MAAGEVGRLGKDKIVKEQGTVGDSGESLKDFSHRPEHCYSV